MTALILALLQIADAVTTSLILSHGGRERNTLMSRLFSRFGVRPVLMAKVLAVSAVGFWLEYSGFYVLLALLIAFYIVIVVQNVLEMRKDWSSF